MSSARPTKADIVTDFRRTQILEAARETFARHGVSATTVDGVAKCAGVAKGTVYLYFKSKEEILRHVLDEDLGQLRRETIELISESGTIEARLTCFFAAALAFFDRKRDFFEQVHLELTAAVRKKARQKLGSVYKAQVASWRSALADARRARLIGDVDLDASAMTIVALASGLARQRQRGWSTGPIDAIAAQASATLWKGLAAR